jgi:hypothetical protein
MTTRIRKLAAMLGMAAISLFAALAASSAQATVPALEDGTFECRPITAENELQPPPPLWETRGEPEPSMKLVAEDALESQPCAVGEVAYPKPFNAPHGGPPVTVNGEVESSAEVNKLRSELRTPTLGIAPLGTPPPSPEYKYYRYASLRWVNSSVGGSVKMQVAHPHVIESTTAYADHSLAELNYESGPTNFRTVELGWYSSFESVGGGSGAPHLFTYVNKDGYESNGEPGGDCYNCEFVPVAKPNFSIGQTMEPTEVPIEFAVKYEGGNWWAYVYNQWIGYLKGSFWNYEFTHPGEHSYYGEVYSEEPNFPDGMGNGLFGESIGGAKMSAPTHFPSLTEAANELVSESKNGPENGPPYYNIGQIGGGGSQWNFGGPGGKQIHIKNEWHSECLGVNGSTANKSELDTESCAASTPSVEWLEAPYLPEYLPASDLISVKSHYCASKPPSESKVTVQIQEECYTPSTTGRQRYRFIQKSSGAETWYWLVNQSTGNCLEVQKSGAHQIKEEACKFEDKYQYWDPY